MTLPNLVDSYYKSIAEARLKKFYSVFNQAIILAEAKHGPKESWYQDVRGVEFDDEGNAITETNEIDKWFSKYLENFMSIKKKSLNNGAMVYYLNDGSIFRIAGNNGTNNLVSLREIHFFPFGNYESCSTKADRRGSCLFPFLYIPIITTEKYKYHTGKGLEPYMYNWDGTQNSLYNNGSYGCNQVAAINASYCTAIIQRNGWKVPKDYPKKIRP